jgi:ABC-type molybdate transport system substrate-binding protein
VDAPQAELAAEFVRFVLSDEGQRVLEDHGFVRAGQN